MATNKGMSPQEKQPTNKGSIAYSKAPGQQNSPTQPSKGGMSKFGCDTEKGTGHTQR
jgi:hypothetical protein